MSKQNLWTRLITSMEQERELMDTILSFLDVLRTKLHEQRWASLEKAMMELNVLTDHMVDLEKKRHAIACNLSQNGRVAVQSFPLEFQEPYKKLRLELKVKLTKVRGRIRGMDNYMRSRARLGREILGELIQDDVGYDHRGQNTLPARDALLLSRHL